MKGIAASPGIMIGKAYLLDSEDMAIPQKPVKETSIPKEIMRFQKISSPLFLRCVLIFSLLQDLKQA